MTTEVGTNGCNNIVSHEFLWMCSTCDYISLNAHYCVLSSSKVRYVSVWSGVWLVSGYAHVFVLLSVFIVTLPLHFTDQKSARG